MKCAMPRLSPRKAERIASPWVRVGQGPARTKSSHVVGAGTNVFVSCMKPPIAMRIPALLHAVLHGPGAWRQIRSTPRDERHGRMRNDRIEVRPVAGALGAEIFGLDLAQELDEDLVGAIRRA